VAGAWGALLLIVAGALLGAAGLLVAGVLAGLVVGLRSLWARFGLRSLVYERHLATHRVVWGERTELDLVVRNAKALPLPWLQVDDLVSSEAEIIGARLEPSVSQGFDVLRGTWSVGWYERVTRRLHIAGSRRGTYRFLSAELRVAGLFASATRTELRPLPDTYRVIPRLLAVRSVAIRQSPIEGAARATRGLHEEPSLFAGVRPYQPGDQLRRIHWKATARLGRTVSRRYDPARERELLLAVDIQTWPGDYWMLNWEEDLVEGLCVAALALARRHVEDGVAVGLVVNAFTARPQPTAFVPPSAAPSQVALIADVLAGVSPFASLPFHHLLAGLAQRASQGTSVLALSTQDPRGFLAVLRRLGAQGYVVSHAALGPRAGQWCELARALGVPSAAYRLDPDWRSADALERTA
jgi:uncharacterized protein (DUF58 family)